MGSSSTQDTQTDIDGIAIVSMSGRFPGARSVDLFWDNLKNGVESITSFSDQELDAAGVDQSLISDPTYVKARPVLDDVDMFDAAFFGINPRDAELMDPQHRLFLECSSEALESAGYNPNTYRGSIGVYGGLSLNTYLLNNICADRKTIEDLVGEFQVGSFPTILGNDKDFLPTRVSYKLNLTGPSINVQSGCSTSLVAICQACMSLQNYQCDMALAGGASISFPQTRGYLYQEGGMVSPDGHCRAFDARAQGTIFGAGVGVVLLKRLSDAISDGDSIQAVIRGYALNNDGSRKVSYTAPSVSGQVEVIAMAHAMAGIDAESISYVEAHGTGTPLGDPIEIEALTQAFRATTDKKRFCAIGTAKTNVGHLEIAAGVTGVIKTVLAMKNRQLPPSLHFNQPNPQIDFDSSPFYVNNELTEWKPTDTPLRAGVSSFGVGGTNAHIVIEEAPIGCKSGKSRPAQLVMLSAMTGSALENAAAALAGHLRNYPDTNIADVAYTLQTGRQSFSHRKGIVCENREQAIAQLEAPDQKQVWNGIAEPGNRTVAMMFPGQGAQAINMASELYQNEQMFRNHVDYCAAALIPELGLDLRSVLFPQDEGSEEAERLLEQTFITQPALFVVSYALSRLWMEWGVEPKAMLGHSIGEYVAACIAGVFSLEDALKLIAARGRLVQQLPAGGMLAIRSPESGIHVYLADGISLAAVNGPNLCVVAGPIGAIEVLHHKLKNDGKACRRLRTSHAFHSNMLDPILTDFRGLVQGIQLSAPQIPYISNVTGTWITPDQSTDPDYWVRHLRETVRFSDGIQTLIDSTDHLLLEVGPGNTLSTIANQHSVGNVKRLAVSSLGRSRSETSDTASLLEAVCRLWLAGVDLNWMGFYTHEQRQRVALPTYPFERKRFWIEPVHSGTKDHNLASVYGVNGGQEDRTRQAQERVVDDTTAIFCETSRRNDAASGRRAAVAVRVMELLHKSSGVDLSPFNFDTSFLEMGFDSLYLTQASQMLHKEFKVKVTFRQLLGDLSSINSLSSFIDDKLPTEMIPQFTPFTGEASSDSLHLSVEAPSTRKSRTEPTQIHADAVSRDRFTGGTPALQVSPSGREALEAIVKQQLQVMAQQLESLRSMPESVGESEVVGLPPGPATQGLSDDAKPAVVDCRTMDPQYAAAAKSDRAKADFKAFGPYKPINSIATGGLTDRQLAYIANLVQQYNARTPNSKLLTQVNRAHHADPRAVSGFRVEWKDMVYPISVERSLGSKLWDVDGNEYIDMLNGFGVTMLGHSPQFVTDAVEAQLKKGVEIGPQSPLAGEVARLICEFTGMDRACFCNTGSEAVMAALRVARTVTARDKIVLFAGSYHGSFDEVLVRANHLDGKLDSMPIAPGIPLESVENVIVLEYGSQESLDILQRNAGNLAAVLVETVQSRHPDLQPVEFLKEVRRITEASGIALIFDEVVTGFRVHPGGVQSLFGIRADMATYGKVIGGGFPIGVLAGKSEYLDVLDGGMWSFGDNTVPEVGVTFHAGTFVRHPLVMAAATAVLNHLKQEGPALQERLNERASGFAARLNTHFERNNVPTRIRNFCSILYFSWPSDLRFSSLLYYGLRLRGVHIMEGFPCFLTTAHTDEDVDLVVRAFIETIAELQEVGFLPKPLHPDEGTGLSDNSESLLSGERSLELEPSGVGPSVSGGGDVRYSRAPLTEAQKEIWLSAQMGDDASCAYNESCTVHLSGQLNEQALRAALQDLVNRHDALRTTFDTDGEYQHFAAELMLEPATVDLTSYLEREQTILVEAIVKNEARTPFNLNTGPLIRCQILMLSPEYHQVILSVHHIVCDGWSIGVLLNELSQMYSSRLKGVDADFAEPMQFGEYAKVQSESMFESPDSADYWKSRFTSDVPMLDLPTDYPRPPIKSFGGSMERHTIGGKLFEDLKRISAQRGATLFSTLLAGFNLLLYRLSGQGDLVVGIPAAGQSMVGSPDLVGHCLNFLPLRSEIVPGCTFAEYASQVKTLVLDAYDHQEYTYGTLIRALNLPRDVSRLPLLSVMFNVDPGGLDTLAFSGLQCRVSNNPKCFVNMDLFLNIGRTATGLNLECDYNSDLFDRDTVTRWLHHYESLLQGVADNWDQEVSALPLLSCDERQTLLETWNDTRVEYAFNECVHDLIVRQVELTPNAIAATCENKHITYRQLDSQANQLARYLQSRGVVPDTLVGILLDRSIEMLVGLLAVWKAGGAYVPLDPAYPADRIKFMLDDSRLPVLLTQSSLVPLLPALSADVVCIEIDTEWETIAKHDHSQMAGTIHPSSLAYVIYTSGSTGQPKGVQIEHRALVNFLCSMQQHPGLTSSDVLVAVTTLSFDIAGLELWLPLITGARLIIASRDVAGDGTALAQVLKRESATVMQATPATWRLLLEAGWDGGQSFKVLCGGEALPVELARELLTRCSSLWNMYGPTETTIWSTLQPIESVEGPIAIGRPIANTQIYLLDAGLQPVPVGVAGEMYIGGDGLARGYLHRPELTDEKFITNPHSDDHGSRIYKTGDMARYRSNGTIEFLGRNDNQCKIRGFRIELGEIEAALNSIPGISRSAVIVREDTPGDRRLAAYIVPDMHNIDGKTSREGSIVSYVLGEPMNAWMQHNLSNLRSALLTTLPEHMIPAAFVAMEALPLTPNTKLDRLALPAPDWGRISTGTQYVAPFTANEKILARIWMEVLRLEQVGINDNIFELGGDSLLIFRITTRTREAGLPLTPRDYFRFQTIAELAEVIKTEVNVEPVFSRPSITRLSRSSHVKTRSSLQN